MRVTEALSVRSATLTDTERTRMADSENTKLIPLTQGKFAIVDVEDYQWLSQWKWYAENSGDTLDNRRCNLRIATHSQNNCNQRKTRGISQYKGVYFYKNYGNWRAQIQIDGKMKFIGYYSNEIEAARAYNEAAVKKHGEFAKLNVFTDA